MIITPLYAWPWSGQTKPVLKPCLKILDEMFFYTDGTSPLCCWDEAGRGGNLAVQLEGLITGRQTGAVAAGVDVQQELDCRDGRMNRIAEVREWGGMVGSKGES